MRKGSALLSTLLAVTVFSMLAVSAAASSQGTVVYRVQGKVLSTVATSGSSTPAESFTITETVSPGPNSTFDSVFLGLTTGSGNFTLTKLLNSSLPLEPYIPAITNKTYSYSENGSSITATIQRNGTVPITFNGGRYSLASYALTVSIVATGLDLGAFNITSPGSSLGWLSLKTQLATLPPTNETVTLTGSLYVFPSGLVYSFKTFYAGVGELSVTLVSTNLSLAGPSPSTTVEIASLGVGAGAIVSALALGVGVRQRNLRRKAAESKPDHWVD